MLTFLIVRSPSIPAGAGIHVTPVGTYPELCLPVCIFRCCLSALTIQYPAPHMFCMDNTAAALAALRGTTIQEKMVSIGVDKGRMIDIRHLDEISRDYGIMIYLFFEKDLATTQESLQRYRKSSAVFPSTSGPTYGSTGSLPSRKRTIRPLRRPSRSSR